MAEYPQYDLREAWKEYWPRLTDGATTWEDDLADMARTYLTRPTLMTSPDANGDDRRLKPDDIHVCFDDQGSRLKVTLRKPLRLKALEPLTGNLFTKQLLGEDRAWTSRNPIAGFIHDKFKSETGDPSEPSPEQEQLRWNRDCEELVAAVAYHLGKKVRRVLEAKIASGDLWVYALGTDVASGRVRVHRENFDTSFVIDGDLSGLRVHNGVRPLQDVRVHHPKAHRTNTASKKSLAEADAPFVEEMHRMIVDEEVKYIIEAARIVAPRAESRDGACLESVERRLFARYRKKYGKSKSKRQS